MLWRALDISGLHCLAIEGRKAHPEASLLWQDPLVATEQAKEKVEDS